MIKGNKFAERRIKAAVTSFIEAEVALIMPIRKEDFKENCTTRFFRLQSIGKRLTRKIQSYRNATVVLKSKDDFEVYLKIGNFDKERIEVTIENNDLCFNKS